MHSSAQKECPHVVTTFQAADLFNAGRFTFRYVYASYGNKVYGSTTFGSGGSPSLIRSVTIENDLGTSAVEVWPFYVASAQGGIPPGGFQVGAGKFRTKNVPETNVLTIMQVVEDELDVGQVVVDASECHTNTPAAGNA